MADKPKNKSGYYGAGKKAAPNDMFRAARTGNARARTRAPRKSK